MSAAKRRGLGRGLDALIAPPPQRSGRAGDEIVRIELDRLEPNRLQPRTQFEDEQLQELADSIRAQGVIQPLVVVEEESGRYRIVAGERRWRAARMAGLETVPVVVRDVAEEREWLELALIENLQRADLNPIEEAEAYSSLQDRFHLTQAQIAERVGKSRAAIANALRLLRLPAPVLDDLRAGKLSAGQARPLLGLGDADRQVALARRIVAESLSAREAERLAAEPGAQRARPRRAPDSNTLAAQERLTRALQTRVEIRRRARGGTIRIHFHGEDELMRLYDLLVERAKER